jgi:hypothetical protein
MYKVNWEQELRLFMSGGCGREVRFALEMQAKGKRETLGGTSLGEQKNSILRPWDCLDTGFHDLMVGPARMGRQNSDRN